MKPWRIAVAYVALSVLALALFAGPLWHGWRVSVGTLRVFVPEDMQALVDLFHREGAEAVAAAVSSRADPGGHEVIAFAGPSKQLLAGTLGRWPAEIPDAPGTYGHVIDPGDGSRMRIVVSRVNLPGDYHLIIGRESTGLMSMEGRFWVGMAAAVSIVMGLGAALALLLARRANAAQQSEERYVRALQASNDGIWEWNLATDQLFLSDRALRLWAVPDGMAVRTRGELNRVSGFRPREFDRAREVIESGCPSHSSAFDMEYRRQGFAGEEHWLRSQAMVFQSEKGRPTVVTGSLTDVTEQKRAGEAVRLSDERYRLAMEASEEGHYDVNLATGDSFLSNRLNEILGLAPVARVGALHDYVKQVRFYDNDADKAQVQIAAAEAKDGPDRYETEFRIVRTSGDLRWVSMRGVVIRDAQGVPRRHTGVVSDVTARKLAEMGLSLSEQRYALAMEAAGDGHIDWDLQTAELYVSPRLLHICGHAPGATFRDHDDWVNRFPFHPDDRPKWTRAIEGHFVGRELHLKMELRMVVRGEVRWAAMHFLTTRDPIGRPVRWTGAISDITEQKRTEEALRESEERYALAVAGSEDGLWDVDFAAGQVFFSARARQLAGMTPGPEPMTLEQYRVGLPLHPDDEPRRAAAELAHLKGGAPAYEGEYRMRQLDGEYRWRRIRGLCVRDASGTPYRMAGSISDVDARRRAEDARRLSEERYALAMEVAEEGHLDWSVETNEFFASAQAVRILKVPRDLECHTAVELMHHVPFHSGDRDEVMQAWQAAFAGSCHEYEIESRLLHDAKQYWVRWRWRIYRGGNGAAQRVIGVVSDITERKLAEEDLSKMDRELRRAQRLEALGTLAGGIAHDFNNILGAILGYCEMALQDAKRGTRIRRDLDIIQAAGERGRALVDRVLAFSPSGVGERIPVHVQAVVHEALDQISASLPPTVSIAPRLSAGRAAMLGDSTQVHQVVANLAANGVQAMPHGGILAVSLDVTNVEEARAAVVGKLVPGEYLVLTVSDTGDGITTEVFERMFDPFFTTKEVGVGSGLGLSLVHGIVTNVDGAVDVDTTVGKGTTFTVYLPRFGDAPVKPPEDRRPLPHGDGERVLVVDDEEPLVRLTTEMLRFLGYEPVSFVSSTAALAAFREEPTRYDAVLTDERMPMLSGSALIRELRSIRKDIPVVLMSGYVGMEVNDADVVVKKPLSASVLAGSLAQAIMRSGHVPRVS